jgi:translation initiation factor 1
MTKGNRPFHNPFAALDTLRDTASAEAAPAPAGPPPPEIVAAAPRAVARAVVRMERAGRGGREVTVIEHLGLPNDALTRWLKDLKTALGCGGAIEGDAIVLQGDQRKRLPALLTGRGVKRVTLG